MTSERRRETVAVAASLAALALVTPGRIWLVHHLHDQGWFVKYLYFADRILSGHLPRTRLGDLSPAYLWLITALRAVHLAPVAMRDLQVIGVSVAALLAAVAAKRLAGWPAAIVAALLILGNRAAFVIATDLEPEVLILVLNAAALLFLVRRNYLLAGLFLGFSAITRPVAILMIVFAAAILGQNALRLLAGAAIPIVTIVLVNLALTGNAVIMSPGTVFFEGNNALSTGCAGVMPRIINDLSDAGPEPDYLHVAYRIVASRATGAPATPKVSNRYWTAKSLAWMRSYPGAALSLLGSKALLAIHNYEAYDLADMKRKSDELSRFPAIPFGLAVALAITALALRRPRRDLLPVLLIALASFLALVAFNVGSRQRTALLAPLAILGGAGAAEVVALARAKSERSLLAFGAIVIATALLGIEGSAMEEDRYNWQMAFESARYYEGALAAQKQGDAHRAAELAAIASIENTSGDPLVSAHTLREMAEASVNRFDDPRRRFDAAIALEKAGAWRDADAVLQSLAGYRPRRENHAVSSVAYYRARAALHLGAPRAAVLALLQRADGEAGGDPFVLALMGVLGDASAGALLERLYDPFTRDWALAAAFADIGEVGREGALRGGIRQRMPEWWRVR